MSEVKIRKYTTVTFHSHAFRGAHLSHHRMLEVASREPMELAKMAFEGAFAFTLQDWTEKSLSVDGEDFVKIEPDGEPSGLYYLGGIIWKLPELYQKFRGDSSKRIMLINIGMCGGVAIQTGIDSWHAFYEKDQVLDMVA